MKWHRFIYSIVVYLISPLVPVYLLWRARHQPEYAHGWLERFAWSYGNAKRSDAPRRIWLHAVSLGETRATKPLVDELLKQKNVHIILTHTTPTGRAAGQTLFENYLQSGQITQVYVPYDLPDVVSRFLRHFAPTDCWLMETEIWPNSIAACVKRKIPVALVNGRMSDKTLQSTLKYAFVATLFRHAYAQLSHVCAQSPADEMRYIQLGAHVDTIAVTGNLKFDMEVPQSQVAQGLTIKQHLNRPVVLLACTREGEEQMWLDAIPNFNDNQIQWWIVPRHPQRFDEVERLLQQAGFTGTLLVRKTASDFMAKVNAARVVLGDTMGEMFAYYALANVVLMGGAWQPLGGQNFLEPLSLGKPTIIGAHTYNFAQSVNDAVAEKALSQVSNMTEAFNIVQSLLQNNTCYEHEKKQAIAFVGQHKGATQKTLSQLKFIAF